MLNLKVMIIHLIAGLILTDVNVKVGLSNYATKADIKNISHVYTSSFALKTDLPNLKTKVDKLVRVPVDISKLSDLVKNDVVRNICKIIRCI